MITLGSHFGTPSVPETPFLAQKGVAFLDLLQFCSEMCSAVPLWALKDVPRTPQGRPRVAPGSLKDAPGSPKDASRTLFLHKMAENVWKNVFLVWKYTNVY